uniref:Uncharacterized protein n=1 Tax=Anguilla anguilla TaxID=7936 RepID=A0A0E9RKG5_ANGAN
MCAGGSQPVTIDLYSLNTDQ